MVFSLVLLFAGVVSCSKHTPSPPYAVVPENVCNFSKVDAGEKLTHSFYIKNTGEQPLFVQGIASQCKCLFARINNREIKAHQQATLLVTFDSTGLSGVQDHKIILHTNATNERIITFNVKAYVEQPFSLQPENIDFGNITNNALLSQTITFTSASIEITSVTSLSPFLDTHFSKTSKNNYAIKINLIRRLPAGLFKTKVLIYTSSLKFPVLTLPVNAKKVSDIQANPDDIFAGILLKGGASSEFTTYIFSRHKRPFSIKRVYDTNNYLKINVERFAPDILRLDIKVNPFKSIGEYTTDIMVLTTNNKTPVLQIPFRVIVMDK